MNCIQKQQLVSFPKVRIWKPWFRHFNNHKEFRNEGTVHLFSLMALFSYANFRSNERMISGERYMEAPGQWICKLGSLPRILRVHSKRQALEQLNYYEKYGFLTYEWLDKENEIIRFSIINWKEHCTSLQYNYYSYKGSGFFFFPLPVGRMLLRIAHKTEGIVFSELDAIMDMWLHTILNDPKVRGSEYMPVVYYSNMRGVPLLSYTYLAKRWGWSKSRVGRFMLKAGEYGIISRVSFSSSRGSVISMCRYREMIFGDTCEELELLHNALPVLLISLIIAVGLWRAQKQTIFVFNVFGRALTAIAAIGFAIGIIQELTPVVILPEIASVLDGIRVVGSVAIVLCGAYPMLEIVNRVFGKSIKRVGSLMGIDQVATQGIIGGFANIMPILGSCNQMSPAGITVASAFAVSASCAFGDHLGFIASVDKTMLMPMIVSKLVGGGAAVLLAIHVNKKKS